MKHCVLGKHDAQMMMMMMRAGCTLISLLAASWNDWNAATLLIVKTKKKNSTFLDFCFFFKKENNKPDCPPPPNFTSCVFRLLAKRQQERGIQSNFFWMISSHVAEEGLHRGVQKGVSEKGGQLTTKKWVRVQKKLHSFNQS